MTDSDVIWWQHNGYWVFFCRCRSVKSHMIHMCRSQLGKSHGAQSVWQVSHVKHPGLPDHPPVSVILVKDHMLATQFRLTYT